MAWANGQVLDRDAAEVLLASHPGAVRTPAGAGETAAPHPGTLDSLVDRHRRKRERLRTVSASRGKSHQLFTQPPKASFRHVGYDTPPRRLHFELRGSEGGFAPRALAAAAPLLTGLRDAAARRLQDSLPAKATVFERLVIGRGAGARDVARRVRLVPIPSIASRVPQHDAVALSGAQRRRIGPAGEKTKRERNQEERQAAGAVVQALRHAGFRIRPTDIRVQREPFQRRGVRAEPFAAGSRVYLRSCTRNPLASPLRVGHHSRPVAYLCSTLAMRVW